MTRVRSFSRIRHLSLVTLTPGSIYMESMLRGRTDMRFNVAVFLF